MNFFLFKTIILIAVLFQASTILSSQILFPCVLSSSSFSFSLLSFPSFSSYRFSQSACLPFTLFSSNQDRNEIENEIDNELESKRENECVDVNTLEEVKNENEIENDTKRERESEDIHKRRKRSRRRIMPFLPVLRWFQPSHKDIQGLVDNDFFQFHFHVYFTFTSFSLLFVFHYFPSCIIEKHFFLLETKHTLN